MKRRIAISLFSGLFGSVAGFGQVYVNGVAIDTTNTPYCQLICANSTVLTKTGVTIDHGQRWVDTGLNRQKIAGPDRQPVMFNSSIDALNFMVRHGWELVSFQVTSTSSGTDCLSIYLLQRKRAIQGAE